jgi:hypothetical protein
LSIEMTPYKLWHGIKPKLSFLKFWYARHI